MQTRDKLAVEDAGRFGVVVAAVTGVAVAL